MRLKYAQEYTETKKRDTTIHIFKNFYDANELLNKEMSRVKDGVDVYELTKDHWINIFSKCKGTVSFFRMGGINSHPIDEGTTGSTARYLFDRDPDIINYLD